MLLTKCVNLHLRFLNVFRSLGLLLTMPIPAVVIFAETALPASVKYKILKNTNFKENKKYQIYILYSHSTNKIKYSRLKILNYLK